MRTSIHSNQLFGICANYGDWFDNANIDDSGPIRNGIAGDFLPKVGVINQNDELYLSIHEFRPLITGMLSRWITAAKEREVFRLIRFSRFCALRRWWDC